MPRISSAVISTAPLVPTDPETLARLARAHEDANELPRAAQLLRDAVRLNPTSTLAHCNLGDLFSRTGRYGDAIGCYTHALRLDSYSVSAAAGLGTTMQRAGDVAAAAHYYREALRIDPLDADVSNKLATALRDCGELNAAIAQFRETLRLDPNHAYAIFNLSQFTAEGRFQFDAEELAKIEARIEAETESDFDRSLLCFAVAAVCDSHGLYDAAFGYYRRANELRKKSKPFDVRKQQELIDKLIKIFDEEYFRLARTCGRPSLTPIFIVGMPRTGSTLVEQILATDASVYAAGELGSIPQLVDRLMRSADSPDLYGQRLPLDSDAAVGEFADRLLAHLAKISRGSPHVTIKTPENFLHLGVIATIYPQAHVIHCVRDPRDVALSCYFQNFKGIDYSHDLEDIVAYYRGHERLAAHWRKTLPIRMHEVRYEELIRQPEATTRSLFEHCGLSWTPQCLRFFENKGAVQTASSIQVRKPLSAKSIGRWKRYRKHLGPLLAALGDMAAGQTIDGGVSTPQPESVR